MAVKVTFAVGRIPEPLDLYLDRDGMKVIVERTSRGKVQWRWMGDLTVQKTDLHKFVRTMTPARPA